jgi:outer membrane protein, heavy metal efflux system
MGTRAMPIVSLLLLGGCATLQPRLGMKDVEGLLAERTAAKVAWDLDGSASAEIEARVGELLKGALTAEHAVQVALLNNRSLQAVYERLGIAQAELVQAGLLPNPVLDANIRFGLGPSGTGTEIGLVQQLLTVLQIPLKKQLAGAAFEQAKLEVADAVLELVGQVRVAFYREQAALQMLELRRKVVQATALSAETAKRQREAGNVPQLDAANEQALYQESRLQLAEAEAEVLAGREELNALLGLWGKDITWKMAERLPRIPIEKLPGEGLQSRAVEKRLDLAAARAGRVVAFRGRELSRLYGLIPDAGAGVAAEREIEGGVWSLGPSISIALPVFDQRQATLGRAAAEIRQSEQRFAALAVQIRADVRRTWTGMEAARSRAEHYERVVLPLRKQVVEQTQLQYNAMLVGIFQLLQAKREQIEAGQLYIESLRDYWVDRSELERAVGTDLGEGTKEAAPPSSESPNGGGDMHQHHHHGG